MRETAGLLDHHQPSDLAIITPSTISALENSMGTPQLWHLARYEQAFGVPQSLILVISQIIALAGGSDGNQGDRAARKEKLLLLARALSAISKLVAEHVDEILDGEAGAVTDGQAATDERLKRKRGEIADDEALSTLVDWLLSETGQRARPAR